MKKRKPIRDWAEDVVDVLAVAMIGLIFIMALPVILEVILVVWSNLFSYLGF